MNFWLPEHVGELLVVTIDPSQSGDTEWDGMALINQAAFDWLNGKLDTGTYFDILEHVGISPDVFVSETEDYISHLICCT